MGLLYYVSYVAVAAAVCFVIMSLASGLLYVSELIEEHAKVAKYYGQRGIYAIIVLHVLLCMSDSLPITLTMFSIICHILYLQNFSNTWPLISLTSPIFLCSCVLVVVDHFVWFFHFSRMTTQYHEQARRYGASRNAPHLGFKEIATFFGICVWLAPLFLFLSLSANDNALPTSSSSDATATPPASSHTVTRKNRVSLFRSIFSSLPLLRKREDVIIAPPSPYPQAQNFALPSPGFVPSSPRLSAYSNTTTPPRSPRSNAFDKSNDPSSMRLDTPPRRASTMRGPERIGLLSRKSSTPSIVGENSIFND